MPYSIYTLAFAANLFFILSALICACFRYFHVCVPYKPYATELFPARKVVTTVLLFSLLDIPFLLNITSEDAIIYTNIYSALFYPIANWFMLQKYLYYYKFSRISIILTFVLCAVVFIPLLLMVMSDHIYVSSFSHISFKIALVSFWIIEMIILARVSYRIHLDVRNSFEMEFSNLDNFPSIFALKAYLISIIWCLLIMSILIFASTSIEVKIIRDIIISIVNIFLTLVILNPQRKVHSKIDVFYDTQNIIDEASHKTEEEFANDDILPNYIEPSIEQPKYTTRLSNTLGDELYDNIINCITSNKLYLNPNLKASELALSLGTNTTYLSAALRMKNKTFCSLINDYRINYCIDLITENSQLDQQTLYLKCGFSSRTSFWRAFKEKTGTSLKDYVSKL